MAARLLSCLAMACAVALSGCTDESGPGAGAPGDNENGNDGGDGGRLGPFFGFDPGVETITLPAGQPGLAEGHVFDRADGTAIQQAIVTATCVRQALPGADDAPTQRAFTAADGSFAFPATAAFADCVTVRYTIDAAGYTLTVPLESGPLVPGVQHLVYGGMTPDP